jgi:serine/threonine protein kinase
LGSGQFGEVWLAISKEMKVAVKLLQNMTSEENIFELLEELGMLR